MLDHSSETREMHSYYGGTYYSYHLDNTRMLLLLFTGCPDRLRTRGSCLSPNGAHKFNLGALKTTLYRMVRPRGTMWLHRDVSPYAYASSHTWLNFVLALEPRLFISPYHSLECTDIRKFSLITNIDPGISVAWRWLHATPHRMRIERHGSFYRACHPISLSK